MATEETWLNLSRTLRSFIARRVGQEQDVDDILQDVLLRVHQKIETLSNPQAMVPWAYQIARNCVADYYRHKRPTEQLVDEVVAEDDEASLNASLANCISGMIADLPEPYKSAVNLVERGSMTQREYAAISGLSVSGAKARVQRARKMLKRKLLACCNVELDRLGNVLDYNHKDASEKYCKK